MSKFGVMYVHHKTLIMNAITYSLKICLTLFLLSSFTAFSQSKRKVKVGDNAFDFVSYDKNGEEFKISSYKDQKYVLINFTSIGCAPCWFTYSQMNRAQDKYADKLKIISVHHEDDTLREKWFEMAGRYKIDFKCTSVWKVKNKEKVLFSDYNIPGFPYYFLIDKNGKVMGYWWGGKNEDSLEKKLNKYLSRS